MFTNTQLDDTLNSTHNAINYKGGFDTFKFRKGFEEDTTITPSEKEQIIDYREPKISKNNLTYQTVKEQIDKEEFLSTDYYTNPYPKKFRGAYSPVVLKTIAGIMIIDLYKYADSIKRNSRAFRSFKEP